LIGHHRALSGDDQSIVPYKLARAQNRHECLDSDFLKSERRGQKRRGQKRCGQKRCGQKRRMTQAIKSLECIRSAEFRRSARSLCRATSLL